MAKKNQKAIPKADDKKREAVEEQIATLNLALNLKHFLASGFEPEISDVELIVMFADVRGFTDYCRRLQRDMQDRKIQNFLKSYLRIFNEGLLMWVVENADGHKGAMEKAMQEVRKYIAPTTFKNLGDGLMIVWEVPVEMDQAIQGLLVREIVSLVDNFQQRFQLRFRHLNPVEVDSYSSEVERLTLGFGIAKGHAWRLDFGTTVDYAGSIINLASRLESVARPRGLVATYDTSPSLFQQEADNGSGVIGTVTVKGYDPVKIWASSFVDESTLPGFKKDSIRGKKKV